MSNPELPDQKPRPERTGLLGSAAQCVARLLGRNQQLPPPPVADITSSRPEPTLLDFHKERAGAIVLDFFNMIDTMTGEQIGYEGNIRDELLGRLRIKRNEARGIDTKGLDPTLAEYMDGSRFSSELYDDEDNLQARYTIDGYAGIFTPSVHMNTDDGSLEARLFMGRGNGQFHQVELTRLSGQERKRSISTFVPNYLDAYAPPHPLMIEQGRVPGQTSYLLYDYLDPDGNVSLLNGQTVSHPNFGMKGRYNAADRTVTRINPPQYEPNFPYSIEDNTLTIGPPAANAQFPLQTNIYFELASMTQFTRGIGAS